MGRVFPGYEGGLRPEFRFLKEKDVIIQAWKKAQYWARAIMVLSGMVESAYHLMPRWYDLWYDVN